MQLGIASCVHQQHKLPQAENHLRLRLGIYLRPAQSEATRQTEGVQDGRLPKLLLANWVTVNVSEEPDMPPPPPPQSQASQICAAESLCLTVSGSTSNISVNLIWTLRYSKISRVCGDE